jgi:hypothetical protein
VKPEHLFTRAGSLSIQWMPRDRYFVCWRPHASVGCTTPQQVLAFARWPASTPTGQALRDWLKTIDLRDPDAQAQPLPVDLQATGFGPEHHEPDPTENTRTII